MIPNPSILTPLVPSLALLEVVPELLTKPSVFEILQSFVLQIVDLDLQLVGFLG